MSFKVDHISDKNQILYTVAIGLREFEKISRSFPWKSRSAYANFLSQIKYLFEMKENYLSSLLMKTSDTNLNKNILRTGIENEIIGTGIIILNDLKNARMNRQAEELLITRIFRRNQQAILDGDVPGVGMGAILFLDCALNAINESYGADIRQSHGEQCASFISYHAEGLNINFWAKLLADLSEYDATLAKDNILESVFLLSTILKQCSLERVQGGET